MNDVMATLIFSGIASIITVPIAWYSGENLKKRADRYERLTVGGSTAEAKILRVKQLSNVNKSTLVTYTYEDSNGKKHKIIASVKGLVANLYPKGTKVKVRYDAEKPVISIIDGTESLAPEENRRIAGYLQQGMWWIPPFIFINMLIRMSPNN
ncbi:hypothetical protein GC177_05035 [bacterium]|nr:hypothetical protein [bacterium]